jgi:hypothetical protein
MLLIPDSEIGVWNVWIFTAVFFVSLFLPCLLPLIVNKDAARRSPFSTVPLNKTERKVDICTLVILHLQFLRNPTAWRSVAMPIVSM